MERVYIEATIPSAYYDERSEPEMVARQRWTREWWDYHRQGYELVTSLAVREEVGAGNPSLRQQRLDLLTGLPDLAAEPQIFDIVDVYIERYVMPRDRAGDALHLALASFHKCDILLTWNCRHLANHSKVEHIRRVNTLLGLHVPSLLTPLELLGEGVEDAT
ncbi:MAG: type II toxin-antitoxin system VapC family toxin [Planctomycetota bacterium]